MKRSLAIIFGASLLGAGSAAHAATDNAPLTCGNQATFYPRGDRWVTVPQQQSGVWKVTPVEYRIQKDGAKDIPGDAEKQAIERAAARWGKASCASNQTPNIGLVRGADFATRGTGDTASEINNVIYWLEGGTEGDWHGDAQTIALTTNLSVGETGYTVTSDMAFNGVNFDFRARGTDGSWYGCSTSGDKAATCYDVEAVALHEFGHFLGFDHVQCTDAVMYAKGDPKSPPVELSFHERSGVCALYPPRDPQLANRDFGEQCAGDAQCGTGMICAMAPSATVGWCSLPCSKDDSCPAAYICGSVQSRNFCRPGPHLSGNVPVNPTTDNPADLCMACSSGDQCSNNLCVTYSGQSLCTVSCQHDQATGLDTVCPTGMKCITVDAAKVCWPTATGSCGTDTRAALNEQCYADATASSSGEEEYVACGPNLICFVFRPRCTGQVGACVTYCNDSDTPCPDPNQTCCYGVDSNGTCVTTPTATTANKAHAGGCFDIRREGQSCVTAEQSVCAADSSCFNFGDAASSKCYRSCSSANCGSNQQCFAFTISCDSTNVSLCCNNGTGTNPACEPAATSNLLDVGVICELDSDCEGQRCYKIGSQAACTRKCDPITKYGCPEATVDVNGDGKADGGFDCLKLDSEGICWPKRGPLPTPAGWKRTTTSGHHSSCSALGGEGFLLAPLLPVAAWWRRRRKAAPKAIY
jgi:hypothetical protein